MKSTMKADVVEILSRAGTSLDAIAEIFRTCDLMPEAEGMAAQILEDRFFGLMELARDQCELLEPEEPDAQSLLDRLEASFRGVPVATVVRTRR